MLGTRNCSIFSFIVIAALASPLGAQNRTRADNAPARHEMTPAQRTFGQTYVAAITGSDIGRYLRLIHPRTRACMNESNAEFFSAIFQRRVGRVARNPHLSVKKVKDTRAFSPARTNGLNYPTRPSHTFHINLVSSGPRQAEIVVLGVRENGIWYEVLPCPSAKSLDLIRETKHRAAADSVKALVLADSLQEPLRGELLALLTDSGSVTAAKRYSDVAQVDLATARRVVRALEKQTVALIAPAAVSDSIQNNTVTDPVPGKPVIDAAPTKPVADSVPNKPVADSVQNNP